MTTAKNILDVARKYMGSVEGGSNHAHILSVYNNTKPLPVGYKVSATDSWCATFVSFCAIEAGVPNFYGRECSVPRYVTIFESLGIWLEDGTVTPKVGDIIVYNWDDSTQPNDGNPDHIGFVEKVEGRTITTIEGNKNDSVSRRQLSVGNGNIRGYARPKYSGTSTTPGTPNKTIGQVAQEVINGKWGSGSDRIAKLQAAGYDANAVQSAVNAALKGSTTPSKPSPSYSQIKVDGFAGFKTFFRTQQVLGIPADGKAGPQTWSAIQKAVGARIDGKPGYDTYSHMQRHFGTPVDGKISSPSMMVKAWQAALNQNKF